MEEGFLVAACSLGSEDLWLGKLPCALLSVSHWCQQHPYLIVTAPNSREKHTFTVCHWKNTKTPGGGRWLPFTVVSHFCRNPRESWPVSSTWLATQGRDADVAISLDYQRLIIAQPAVAESPGSTIPQGCGLSVYCPSWRACTSLSFLKPSLPRASQPSRVHFGFVNADTGICQGVAKAPVPWSLHGILPYF